MNEKNQITYHEIIDYLKEIKDPKIEDYLIKIYFYLLMENKDTEYRIWSKNVLPPADKEGYKQKLGEYNDYNKHKSRTKHGERGRPKGTPKTRKLGQVQNLMQRYGKARFIVDTGLDGKGKRYYEPNPEVIKAFIRRCAFTENELEGIYELVISGIKGESKIVEANFPSPTTVNGINNRIKKFIDINNPVNIKFVDMILLLLFRGDIDGILFYYSANSLDAPNPFRGIFTHIDVADYIAVGVGRRFYLENYVKGKLRVFLEVGVGKNETYERLFGSVVGEELRNFIYLFSFGKMRYTRNDEYKEIEYESRKGGFITTWNTIIDYIENTEEHFIRDELGDGWKKTLAVILLNNKLYYDFNSLKKSFISNEKEVELDQYIKELKERIDDRELLYSLKVFIELYNKELSNEDIEKIKKEDNERYNELKGWYIKELRKRPAFSKIYDENKKESELIQKDDELLEWKTDLRRLEKFKREFSELNFMEKMDGVKRVMAEIKKINETKEETWHVYNRNPDKPLNSPENTLTFKFKPIIPIKILDDDMNTAKLLIGEGTYNIVLKTNRLNFMQDLLDFRDDLIRMYEIKDSDQNL